MITCQHCRYFRPDMVNPISGMGRCLADARHGFFYPDQKHSCRDYSDSVTAKRQEPRIDE